MSEQKPEGTDHESDLPRRTLSAITALTSAGRGDWGRAMLAELGQVTGREARWRFALGSARAVLAPPGTRALGLIPLAAVAAAVAIHLLAPATGIVAAVALPGFPALLVLAAARSEPPRPAEAAGRAAQVIAVAGIVACPVLAIREYTLYPGNGAGSAAPETGAIMTFIFSAELACYLLIVLWRPGLLGASRHSGLPGLAAALAISWVFVAHQPPGGQSDNPVIDPVVLATAAGILLGAGALAALPHLLRRGKDHGALAGLAEVMWGVLLSGPAAFIANVLTTTRGAIAAEATSPDIATESQRQGATSVLAWIAHDDLGGAIVLFTFFSICIAVILAALQLSVIRARSEC